MEVALQLRPQVSVPSQTPKAAFSTLSYLYADSNTSLDALGGLTEEEMRAVCTWATEEIGMMVVEVETLFGLTAREIATWIVGGKVIAVDEIFGKDNIEVVGMCWRVKL